MFSKGRHGMPQYKGAAASIMTPGIKSPVRLNAFEFVVLERLATLVNNFVSRAPKEVPTVAVGSFTSDSWGRISHIVEIQYNNSVMIGRYVNIKTCELVLSPGSLVYLAELSGPAQLQRKRLYCMWHVGFLFHSRRELIRSVLKPSR